MSVSGRLPPWDLLASFLEVAEAGGLSAAARRGGTSQPTLSRRIEALETFFGVPLFERRARGLRLTEIGEGVLAHVSAMRDEVRAAASLTNRRADALSGCVRITTSQVLAANLLPAVLARVRASHAEIAVEVSATDDIDNLLEHQADIAVRVARPEQSTLVSRRVGVLSIGAFAHADYLRRRGVPRTLDDLRHHDLVGDDRHTLLRDALKALGAPLPREAFTVRCDDQMVQWNAVRAGAGIGFIATFVGARARKEGVQRVLGDVAAPLPVWIAARREVRSLKRVRTVFDVLAAEVAAALR